MQKPFSRLEKGWDEGKLCVMNYGSINKATKGKAMKAKKESKKGDPIHLQIEGEMTIYRAQELKELISPALVSGQDVEISLAQVTEMDSTGLNLMLAAKHESILRGSQLSVVGHSQAVQEVFDMCDLGSFFGDPVVLS
jgi:anti-anti-sigma factor